MRNRDRKLNKFKTFNILNPIKESARDGVFGMSTTSLEKYKANLYTLIFTGIGERVMLPNFGTRLHQLLFGPIDNTTIRDIEVEIKDAVRYWIPEITITKIEFSNLESDMENNKINISIFFSLVADEEIQDLVEIEFGA